MGVDTKAKAAVKKPAAHPNTWVFFEGDFARYNDVKLGLMTHALHYGTAVFEGIRAYWNAPKNQLFLLEPAAHYDRMRRSANVIRMELPHSTEELVHITIEVLRRNEFKFLKKINALASTVFHDWLRVKKHPHNQAIATQLQHDLATLTKAADSTTAPADATACKLATLEQLAPISAVRPDDQRLQADVIEAQTSAFNIGQALQAPIVIANRIVAELQSDVT